MRSVRQLLPCVTRKEEREAEDRLGRLPEQVDWSLYTSLFLRDEEGKKDFSLLKYFWDIFMIYIYDIFCFILIS